MDFVVWLLKHTQRFPKYLRHSYKNRLEGVAFEFEELILMANTLHGKQRQEFLALVDGKLLCLRGLLHYTIDLTLLGSNQFRFAAECAARSGRPLH